MIPTMTMHDILVVFTAGVVVGMIAAAIFTHKAHRFIKRKFG